MPWELNVIEVGGKPPLICPQERALDLGPLVEVQRKLRTALPNIEFYKEPSGPEKLEAMREQGIDVGEVLANIFGQLKGSNRATLETGEYSFEFSFSHQPIVGSVFLDVRGSGDPMPTLRAIITSTGWAIYDLASSRLVDESGWDAFTEWRDRSIQSIKNKDE